MAGFQAVGSKWCASSTSSQCGRPVAARNSSNRPSNFPKKSGRSASGTPTKVTLSRPGEPPSVLTSERRIHIVPLTQNLHDYLGPYGLNVRQLGRSFTQAIVFSGNSQIEMQQPEGTLRLSAARAGFLEIGAEHPTM